MAFHSTLNSNDKVWTEGEQTVPYPNQYLGFAKLGIGIGAATLLGNYRFASGQRGWDYLIKGVRAVEEYSPARILRTFQVSNLLSPLETPSRVYRYFSPEQISVLNRTPAGQAWLENISRIAGKDISSVDIAIQGFRFEKGQLLTGVSGGEVLLKHAGIIRSPIGTGGRLQEGYARSLLGGPLSSTFNIPPDISAADFEKRFANRIFGKKISYTDIAGKIQSEAFMFTGGQTRLSAAGRYAAGYGTSLVERFNRLLETPFELPILKDIVQKVPLLNKLKLGVIPSSGLKTLGKLTAKLGILGTAGYLGYQQLDWATRQSSLLDNTLFSEGITAAAGSIWTKGQIATSRIAELTGAHAYREKQEAIAPGSTDLSKLLAFPIMGAIAGSGYNYFERVAEQIKYTRAGFSTTQASLATNIADEVFRKAIYQTPIRPDLLSAVDDKTTSLITMETEKKLASWQGRIAKFMAGKSREHTPMGYLARVFGQVTPGKLRWMGGAAAGAALVLPFVPGALVPSTRPEELEDIYSGKQLVPVRKGRWWEAGRSPYEGGRIDRYVPHWYPAMLMRSKEKALWGEDAPSPISQWIKANMTYELESKHYYDRPFPISGTFGQEIPLIGPLVAATIGKLIKPPVLMHEDIWRRTGPEGEQVLREPLGFGETIVPGEKEVGAPISPFGFKGIVGEQANRLQDMIGLPGFTMSSIKERLTGSQDLFDQEMQLQSAQVMASESRDYYDRELGGMLMTNEFFRRLYPHSRRQVSLYNPIPNAFANVDWLPGAGERSEDFKTGDPFSKIPLGETRLPGEGYSARFPELEGVAPSDYPLIHRLAILGDVAPYASQWGQTLGQVRAAAAANKELSEEEIKWYKEIVRQVASKKQKREFTPYQYRERARTPIENILASANEDAKTDTGDSWFARTIGTYWETLAHGAETPFEYLTPMSPASKLVHTRTAVEDYARNQVWGSESAFWQHPVRDFLKPFAISMAHSLGWEGIPSDITERRDIEEYFDILKYMKFTGLETTARKEGEDELVNEYAGKRRETLFGINPYTFNFTHIMRALPRRERDYFNDFAKADMEERAEILKMVPKNEQNLMMARWQLEDANNIKKAIKKNLLSEEQVAEAQAAVSALYEGVESEGMPKDKELWAEYISTRAQGESYPDWYRRTKLLPDVLKDRPLPGPDWVGFSPILDLEDIKAKIILDEAKNMYDYDIWPDRIRSMARKPDIEEATEELRGATKQNPDDLRKNINSILAANNVRINSIHLVPISGDENIMNLNIEEDRSGYIKDMIRRGTLYG